MPIMEITIIPLGTETASVSKQVKGAVNVLKGKDDIQYQVTATGTIIEASSSQKLLQIARQMHRAALKDSARVVTSIRIDERRDKELTIEGKVQSVAGTGTQAKPEVKDWLDKKARGMLRRIGICRGQAVLDFGCRCGNYTVPSARIVGRSGKVYAVDKEENRLNQLRDRAGAEQLKNIEIVRGFDWKSKVKESSVDAVLLFDVLHPGYFPKKASRKKLLKKVYEVLKPGGMVLVLPTHVEQRNLPLEDFVAEIEAAGFSMNERFAEVLVHDNKLQKCEILKFKKAGEQS